MYVHKYYERYSLGKEKQFIDENLSCTYICTRKKREEKKGEKKLQQQAVSGGETGEDDDVLQV